MRNESKIEINPRLNTRVFHLSYPEAKASFADPAHQKKMREAYEEPAIIILDNVLDEDTLEGLRLGLLNKTRKFKDKFNEGVDNKGPIAQARIKSTELITSITEQLFGYDLPAKIDRSYRPMISADEPIHFDSYHVDCGLTSLMSILNFDHGERRWHVGPNFAEMCAIKRPEVEEVLKDLKPGQPPSYPMRVAAEAARGPLSDGKWVHKIEFAPNALWYANPKIISHKLVYGRGAIFNTWWIDQPKCKCQNCLLQEAGINVPTLEVAIGQ